ncbi:MAG: hypothetical protein C0602_09820 [Denitrovibrio sp.]|nr:MAG: hypothetical protein C0602_09820 [Denitrovibrio sp.]
MEWKAVMFTMKETEKGFTLLELLIALTLSAIVLTGVYTTLDALLNTKAITEKSYYNNSLLLSARKVIKPYILQMYKDSLNINKEGDNDTLSVRTNNSIKMEKAFPVVVKYYVENGYLIREESSDAHQYEWKIYLLPNVSDFKIQAHNGYRFTDDFDEMDTIIKVSFNVNEHSLVFIAGSGQLSKTTDYKGEKWN